MKFTQAQDGRSNGLTFIELEEIFCSDNIPVISNAKSLEPATVA